LAVGLGLAPSGGDDRRFTVTQSNRQRMSRMYSVDFTRVMQTRHIHAGYWDSGRYDTDLQVAQDRFVDLILSRLPGGAGDRVLDLGCGPGGVARAMADRGRCVVALDLSFDQARLAQAATAGRSASVLHADAAALPCRSGSMDGALAVEFAVHVPERDALFAEVWRVLRPGGHLVIVDYGVEPSSTRRHRWYIEQIGEERHLPSTTEYLEALQRQGFSVLALDDIAFHTTIPYGAALRAEPYRSRLASYTKEYFPGPGGHLAAALLGPLARGWVNAFKRGHARQVLIVAQRPVETGR
jgi:cyclopropane fatty-acyl-phospholipid synthase-like methyltransferase